MSSESETIVYYITSHGYGHGVRSCDILRALLEQMNTVPSGEGVETLLRSDRPRASIPQIHVVTDLDPEFLRSRLPDRGVEFHRRSFDVGMVQLDSVQVDLPATEDRLRQLCRDWDRKVEEETQFLRLLRPGLVVCDIPAIPLQSARVLQIPTIAVGNFSWNWIYGEFVSRASSVWREAIDRYEAAYSQCDLLLRLPFAEPMHAFPVQEDLPLLSTPARADRGRLSDLTGADPDRTWILLSFTTLNWTAEAVRRVVEIPDHEFFSVPPLQWPDSGIHSVGREQMAFSQVLASVDAVISKPGYGIVSECVVNEKPLLYADRRNFLEYPILVAGIERYLHQAHLPSDDLYSGNLWPALQALQDSPASPEVLARGGEKLAAARMLAVFDEKESG